jgi:hypothetical protein
VPVIPATQESTDRRITGQTGSDIKQNPIPKVNQCRKGWQSDSSSGVPAYQVGGPVLPKKEKRRKKKREDARGSLWRKEKPQTLGGIHMRRQWVKHP